MLPRSLRDSASAAISSGDLGLGGSAGVVGVGSGALVVGDGDVDSGGGVEVVVVVGSVSMGVSSLSVCLGSLNKVQQKGGDRCKPECEGRKSNVDVSDQKTTRLLDEIVRQARKYPCTRVRHNNLEIISPTTMPLSEALKC